MCLLTDFNETAWKNLTIWHMLYLAPDKPKIMLLSFSRINIQYGQTSISHFEVLNTNQRKRKGQSRNNAAHQSSRCGLDKIPSPQKTLPTSSLSQPVGRCLVVCWFLGAANSLE